MDHILEKFIPLMEPLTKGICESHNLKHMVDVYEHAKKAILELHENDDIKTAILLAALLHDIDDRKFFGTENYFNAKMLLEKTGYEKYEDLVIKMIEYVSAFTNRNNVDEECKKNTWLLIPRICDRVEAIGEIGIKRCLQYSKTVNRPIFTENTYIATTKKELYEKAATKKRYNEYKGWSNSVIDHMYDKLLHICDNPCQNKYLERVIAERKCVMEDFCLDKKRWNYSMIE